MPFEDAQYVQEFNPDYPEGTDPRNQGDDHIRSVKLGVQQSFPNMTAPWTTTDPITAGAPTTDEQMARAVDTQTYKRDRGLIYANGTTFPAVPVGWTVTNPFLGEYQVVFDNAASEQNAQVAFVTRMDYGGSSDSVSAFAFSNIAMIFYVKDDSGNPVAGSFSFAREYW